MLPAELPEPQLPVEQDEGGDGEQLVWAARSVPSTRQLLAGTWVARYEGLRLKGRGATEGEAAQELAEKFADWMCGSAEARDEFVQLLATGGSADVQGALVPRSQRDRLFELVMGEAMGELAPGAEERRQLDAATFENLA